ncbi:MAG TPA: hypothetical protein DDZ91_09955 [Firmicutes bacterium]|jgi:hypothetical protein|nr:hypothetical protein [Bacillota bacterium]
MLYLKLKARQFLNNQKGSLDDAMWKVGTAVIVVLVIVAIIVIAPGQATSLFNTIIDYAKDSFGL